MVNVFVDLRRLYYTAPGSRIPTSLSLPKQRQRDDHMINVYHRSSMSFGSRPRRSVRGSQFGHPPPFLVWRSCAVSLSRYYRLSLIFNFRQLLTVKRVLFFAVAQLFVISLLKRHFKPTLLAPKCTESFSVLVIGVLTTQEYFNARVGFQLSTALGDLLQRDAKIVVSIERGILPFSQFIYHINFKSKSTLSSLTLFESKCTPGYSQLLCRTLELLAHMMEKYPSASWYFRIDDDTLLIPNALGCLLHQLSPRESIALGSASFYFCPSHASCTHKRYPGLPWKDIDQVVSLIRGGAGYILSPSVTRWVGIHEDRILATAQQLNSSAEDLVLFHTLQNHMKGFKLVQARSFLFERPEVALRSSLSQSVAVTPVSFHMHHNLTNGHSLYRKLNALRVTEDLIGRAGVNEPWVNHVTSSALGKVRAEIFLKLDRCLHNVTEVGMVTIHEDREGGSIFAHLGLLQLLERLGKTVVFATGIHKFSHKKFHSAFSVPEGKRALLVYGDTESLRAGHNYNLLSENLVEAVKSLKTIYFLGADVADIDKVFKDMVTAFKNSSVPFHLLISGESFYRVPSKSLPELPNVRVSRTTDIRLLVDLDELQFPSTRMDLVNTIDLLVDCEEYGKHNRYRIQEYRSRKKSLWEWNALYAVRGYAGSRMKLSEVGWQTRYLKYLSFLRDNWLFHSSECNNFVSCRRSMEEEVADLVMYLRRGRVVLTEKFQNHVILTLLQLPHVYLSNEDESRNESHGRCLGEFGVGLCVSSLEAATEALVHLLLGKSFFEGSWYSGMVSNELT